MTTRWKLHFSKEALIPGQYDESYVQQVLYIIQNHPVADQQILALERAAHLEHPAVDETVFLNWLSTEFCIRRCSLKRCSA